MKITLTLITLVVGFAASGQCHVAPIEEKNEAPAATKLDDSVTVRSCNADKRCKSVDDCCFSQKCAPSFWSRTTTKYCYYPLRFRWGKEDLAF
ncbi:hypothetical protein XA68_15905 [Ophiocordyceps unilateralis]|uniref:Uncharacterized protein n=1 Tax=Ophiocordyceps unilateralis TaxID=268505 RepID=A0A2A9PKK3_OPHUN|nr:hypothetical protein XA68_15905 [Ophiocordyceps unilateralis]